MNRHLPGDGWKGHSGVYEKEKRGRAERRGRKRGMGGLYGWQVLTWAIFKSLKLFNVGTLML